jgi:hypothetical protein
MSLHFFAFQLVNLGVVYILNLPLSKINAYPTIKDLQYGWLVYALAGIIVPLLLAHRFAKDKISHLN